VLFFVISALAGVEPMYQYSLSWFVALFEATLVQAEKARDLHKRIDNLVQHFQYKLYLKVCRARGTPARGTAALHTKPDASAEQQLLGCSLFEAPWRLLLLPQQCMPTHSQTLLSTLPCCRAY
jgi:hypothetical protein